MKKMSELPVELGRDSAGCPVTIDVAKGGHMLITGETRSGKSVMTYLLLGELGREFETVRLVGIDPTSVLLGPFVDRFRDPLLVLGVSDPAKIMASLDSLIETMDERMVKLRRKGRDKMSVFTPGDPLYVIILEELPGIVRALDAFDKASGAKPADRFAGRARLAIERLLSESAKVGFRVVSLAQRPDADVLGGYARAQMTTRIALRMASAEDFRMVFSDMTPEEAKEGVNCEVGVAYIRVPGPEGLERFRSYQVEDYSSYVQRVRGTAPDIRPAISVGADEQPMRWTDEV